MTLKIIKDGAGTEYFYNGLLHREDGPAVEHLSGHIQWRIHGILHRVDGPAVTLSSGTVMWYYKDKLHRIDGPAVIWISGNKKWWVNGKHITSNVERWFSDTGFNRDYTTWTSQEKLQFKLVWG